MTTEQPLVLTNRLYRYIKSSAIVGLIQACVELVTNSHDAYIKSNLSSPYQIDIIVDYKDRKLIVYDQAIGLSGDDMVKNFGQVGDYTSNIQARGYFSRGAKDISAIGNVVFVGIKDDHISEVRLSTTDVFSIIYKDRLVTDDDRNAYNIQKNGLFVELIVKDSIKFPEIDEIKHISKYFSMRDIFADVKVNANIQIINELGKPIHNDRLTYIFPEVTETLIDNEYKVEGYSGIRARFKLYLLKEPINDQISEKYQEYGVLISSGNAIHEVSTLYNDIAGHPYIRHVIGRIECSHINQLMYDFEKNPDDILNPFPILDHSRLKGLNRTHPFTKALLRLPHHQLKYVLQELNSRGVSDTELTNDLSSIFSDLNVYGESFFKEILDTLGNYVQVSNSRVIGYLTKKSSNITTSDSEATFNFKDPNMFSSEEGNIIVNNPTLNIIFTEKDYMEFPYYIYRIDNAITLEINIKDFLVNKCIQKDDNGKIIFSNRSGAEILLIEIVSEALAREVIKGKQAISASDSSNLSTKPSEPVFQELEKLKNMLVPNLYKIISTDNMNTLSFSTNE